MSPFGHLQPLIAGALASDRRELSSRLDSAMRRARERGVPDERALAAIAAAIERSVAERVRRAGLVPTISYPPELPVSAAVPRLREVIAGSQVVVVAGETGSGKSTQLPKVLLEAGCGVSGRIAHTQPRRLAARSIARRLAEELGVAVGTQVAAKVRFGDETGRDTLVKVLTDGMLLAETAGDPRLEQYDAVIVDEAHERSLQIDFLLGYLRRLLPRRPDLKVIVTSATIDVERLAAHFGGAPIVEVAGRGHPIETRYRPPEVADLDEEDPRLLEAIARAIEEIDEAFAPRLLPDVLVFLSGEREIREAAAFLGGRLAARRDTEVLPLFARQALEEQERIFAPGASRRIVLATNVAETSLTVPRIHAVIDPGLARIVRYSARSRVARLPVERISRASARQRAGRAGRLGPGLCIRLTSEEEFERRSEFTQPEILRTNLASVILRMEALGLGRAEDFPFVDPPSARLLADGRATLVELGASTAEGRLTKVGRAMSLLPLDPRLARVVIAAIPERCVNDALVAAAALSVQDPRVRPEDRRDAADLAHARFRDPQGDFASFLRLWNLWRAETAGLGSSARRKWCERNHVAHQRMREWADVVGQLRELVERHFRVRAGEPGEAADCGSLHRAVLAGFAGQVGARTEKGEYRGVSGALFAIHPSSALARRGPNWIVAAEIVETSRRFARVCARIQPEWVERVAPQLCTRIRFEPHYLDDRGQVAAWERTTFGELTVVPKRRVPYGPVDPEGARNVFIQEALVAGRLRTDAEFLQANLGLRAALEAEETRGRRRGLLLEEGAAFEFYDARLPAEVHSGPSFERWRREAEARDAGLLRMREADLLREGAARAELDAFPRSLEIHRLSVPLDYVHEPDGEKDGVTARVPLEALSVLDARRFEWLVPGRLAEKVEALVRALPKHLRVRLFPIDEVVAGAVERLGRPEGGLRARLARHLSEVAQVEIAPEDFRDEALPAHLRMRFEVVDADGSVLAAGRDLEALRAALATQAGERLRASIDPATDPVAMLERDEVAHLPDVEIPSEIRYRRAGIELVGFPALVVERAPAERVALRVLDRAERAAAEHARAVAALLAREVRDAVAHHAAYDPLCEALHVRAAAWGVEDPVGTVGRLLAAEAVSQVGAPRAAAGFARLVARIGPDLHDRVASALRLLHAILGEAIELARELPRSPLPTEAQARFAGILERESLERLEGLDRDGLAHRLRLLRMLRERAARAAQDGGVRDRRIEEELAPLRARVDEALRDDSVHARTEGAGSRRDARRAIERMMDEIEIGRFAPKLPRLFAASERRLDQLLEELLPSRAQSAYGRNFSRSPSSSE